MRRAQVKHNFIVIGLLSKQKLRTQIFILAGVQAAPLLFIFMEVLYDGMRRALRKAPGGPAP